MYRLRSRRLDTSRELLLPMHASQSTDGHVVRDTRLKQFSITMWLRDKQIQG